jgi:hypothetical protein
MEFAAAIIVGFSGIAPPIALSPQHHTAVFS